MTELRLTVHDRVGLLRDISNVFVKSVAEMPRSLDAKIRCPVEEIGRNSVTPSTIERIKTCTKLMV